MTLLEKYPELQQLLRELLALREHNKGTVLQIESLLFAEGALVLLSMERFLRIILGADATAPSANVV